MSRFDYDGPLTAAGQCANHRDRAGVFAMNGQMFCGECAGRGTAHQFQPPRNVTASAPHERNAISKQALAVRLEAEIFGRIFRGHPTKRSDSSVLESAFAVHIYRYGGEWEVFRQLDECRSPDDARDLLKCLRENTSWTPPAKEPTPPPIVPAPAVAPGQIAGPATASSALGVEDPGIARPKRKNIGARSYHRNLAATPAERSRRYREQHRADPKAVKESRRKAGLKSAHDRLHKDPDLAYPDCPFCADKLTKKYPTGK